MNEEHKRKVDGCVDLNIFLMKISAGWPGDVSTTRWKNVLYRCYQYLYIFMYLFCTSGVLLYCFFAYETLEDLAENMSVFVTQVAVTGRLTAILFYDKEMVQLMVTIPKKFFIQYEDYINGAQSKLAVSKIDFARKITLNIMVLYFFTTIAMVFHPLLTIETEDDNASYSAGSHVLPFKSWYPLVPEHSPYYEIQYACQGALTIVEGLFLGTMDTLCIVVLLHYATQFQLLNESLRNMSNNVKEKIKLEGVLRGFQVTTSETDNFLQKSDAIVQHTWNKSSEVLNLMNEAITEQISMTENTNDIIDLEGFVTEGSVKSYLDAEYLKYLKACIRHHQDLLEYWGTMSKFLDPIFIMQTLTASVLMCLLGFQLMVMDLDGLKIVRVALHLMCVIFQLWLFCWFGTNLTTQSADLFSAAYECSWYMQAPCFKHLLRLVILRAEKPVEITAGMLGSLSLPLFASIMRSSYSYLAILRQADEGQATA